MMATTKIGKGQQLGPLLEGLVPSIDNFDLQIKDLCLDSQKIERGDAFVALKGTSDHGIRYFQQAVEAGAVVALSDPTGDISSGALPSGAPIIEIEDLRAHLGLISNRFYGTPSKDLKTICVTGTNGKTSITHIICHALNTLGEQSTHIGTLGIGSPGEFVDSINTTPDLLTLQRALAGWRDRGIKNCAIEASSHALDQGRLDGIIVEVAVFSNLSHEHLDYHGTMDNYGRAKRRLFERAFSHAVINVDDNFGQSLYRSIGKEGKVWPFSIRNAEGENAAYENLTTATIEKQNLDGIKITVASPFGHGTINSSLIGSFNISNLLAAFTALGALGWSFEKIAEGLENAPAVVGRMQVLNRAALADNRLPTVLVDYAHSPDGLRQALDSLRKLTRGAISCVFGCGGDRDSNKRAMMGEIAERYSDTIIVTNDNPRNESPQDIANDILSGVISKDVAIVELDRRAAIELAINQAGAGDIVLVAGKGHERFQRIGAEKISFSDIDCATQALERRLQELLQ